MFEFGDLRLRPVEKEDLKLLHEWENDSETMMYSRSNPMNAITMTQAEQRYEEWIKDEKETRYIIELRKTKEPIGMARLEHVHWINVKTFDTGTFIGKKELWGKGIGKQITMALLEMAFQHSNAQRCEASSVAYNIRAHKVLQECGFKHSGTSRQAHYVNGKVWDNYHFDILREKYMRIRMDLLKRILGHKLKEYLNRYATNP